MMDPRQASAPFALALRTFSQGQPRAVVPTHGGRPPTEADRELVANFYGRDWSSTYEGLDTQTKDGPLAKAEQLAAELWGARECKFIVGGASLAAVAMVWACSRTVGDRPWVVQSTVHRSVATGLLAAGTRFKLVVPQQHDELGFFTAVTPGALHRVLSSMPGVGVVCLSTPAYEGTVADVRALAEVAHRYGALLAVDGSWGSPFGLHPDLPPSPMVAGADIMVLSLHKGIGSLGQTAAMYNGPGSPIRTDVFEDAARALTSTSASTPLYASVDLARQRMAMEGEALITNTLAQIDRLNSSILAEAGVPRLDVAEMIRKRHYGVTGWNPMIVVVPTWATGHTGYEVYKAVRERFGVELSQATPYNVVAQFGVASAPEQIETVFRYIAEAVTGLPAREPLELGRFTAPPPEEGVIDLSGILRTQSEVVAFDQAVGRRAAATLTAYPPGSPAAWTGTVLTPSVLDYLKSILDAGGHLHGGDPTLNTVSVLL